MPLPPSPPNAVTMYAAMRGPRVILASTNRAAAHALAEETGARLTVGFFMPMQGVPTQRRSPTPATNGHGKSKDEMTVKEVAALKRMPIDSVRYAIKSKQLKGYMGGIGPDGGRPRLLVKRADAAAWEPSAHFKRLK